MYKTFKKKSNRNKRKKYIKTACGPGRENNYTCYNNNALFYLKKKWNLKYPNKLISSNNPRDIWKVLNNYLKHICRRESCWLRREFVKHSLPFELSHYTFAPKAPLKWRENPNEWLTSEDINNVMNQYENYYKDFDFIGPSPIDYDTRTHGGECVWDELCNFDLNSSIKKGKKKIGIIFNLDPHYKGGSHWVSLFINIPKQIILYFDSTGTNIPKQIKKFANKVIEQSNLLNIPMKLNVNKVEHQKKYTECGIYSLFFIIKMIKMNIPTLFDTRISDDEIFKFRKKYFTLYL